MCVCVCGLVGVTLGDGQPPIGSDLKRHVLFFQGTKIGHKCPSEAVRVCVSVLSAPAFIKKEPYVCSRSMPIKAFQLGGCSSRRLRAIVKLGYLGETLPRQ